ncbi:unnamed protein product, partial [Discosporangium mesarthrocarpum]
ESGAGGKCLELQEQGQGDYREELGLPPDLVPLAPVFSGLYHHLAQASRLPYMSKARKAQPAEEVMADMEASLLKAIRLQVLDLGFNVGRLSSWRGLAQCASRLLAIFLDIYPPSCHRLGLPRCQPAPSPVSRATPPPHPQPGDPIGGGAAASLSANPPASAPLLQGYQEWRHPVAVGTGEDPTVFGLGPLGEDLQGFFLRTTLDRSALPPVGVASCGGVASSEAPGARAGARAGAG